MTGQVFDLSEHFTSCPQHGALHKDYLKALDDERVKAITASRDRHSQHSEGMADGLSLARSAFLRRLETCPTCCMSPPMHKDPFPCEVWDLLDLLYESWASLRAGDILAAQHFVILRKIWNLRPERYPE